MQTVTTNASPDNAMQQYRLVRQGHAPLEFTGGIIGKGEIGNEQNGVSIMIYRTKAGRYVGEIVRRNRNFHNPDAEVPTYRNAHHSEAAAEIIEWLREGEETLGKASQEAVEQACRNDERFAEAWIEKIE